MSEINRRDFIKGATVIIGGVITAVIGLPTVAYLIDPALRKETSEGWIPVGKLDEMPVGNANTILIYACPGPRLGENLNQPRGICSAQV